MTTAEVFWSAFARFYATELLVVLLAFVLLGVARELRLRRRAKQPQDASAIADRMRRAELRGS